MKKMDEMEQRINQKGIKWSYAFMVLGLLVWGVYHYVNYREASLPLILMILQYVVYFLVTSVEKMKMDDSNGKKRLLSVSGFILLMLVFGAIAYVMIGR